jgi:copper chaperone NosL
MSGQLLRRAGALVVGACVLFAPAPGCKKEPTAAPPAILYGQDACAQCGMIISDEHFAAGAVVRGEDGALTPHAFDDIGCLLDFARHRPADALAAVYVKDYNTRQWCDAQKAVYVRSDQLKTPMASNLAACKTAEAAAELRRRYPGVVTDYNALAGLTPAAAGAASTAPTTRSSR